MLKYHYRNIVHSLIFILNFNSASVDPVSKRRYSDLF